MPDYSHWLTKAQAAEIIGVSTKTIEALAKNRQLHQARLRRPGKPAIVVYHPDDVERVRRARNPDAEPFTLPPEPPPTAIARRSDAPQALLSWLQGLHLQPGAVRVSERLFLTIPEASDYSGLPQTYLRRLLAEGKLKGLKTGAGWRIKRSDLEAL